MARASESLGGDGDASGLLAGIAEDLTAKHPLGFLVSASGISHVLAPRGAAEVGGVGQTRDPGPAEFEPRDLPDLADMQSMLIESGQMPGQAMAYVLARLSRSDLDRSRVDRALGPAVSRLPRWVRELDRALPTDACVTLDPLLAGANVAVGVWLPSGHDLTIVGFIDFDLGDVLTDGFVMDESIEGYKRIWRKVADAPQPQPVSLADARVRLEAGIDLNDHTLPPYESDTWPLTRAITEWVLAMLPDGGADFARHDLTDAEREAIVNDFLRSSHAAAIPPDRDTAELVDLMLDRPSVHNDALLWSPKAVEVFLLNRPQKIMAPRDYLIKIPTVLAAFIEYGHAQRGIDRQLTDEVLIALSQTVPEFEAILDGHDPGDDEFARARQALRSLLTGGPQGVDWDGVDIDDLFSGPSIELPGPWNFFPDPEHAHSMVARLEAKAGGRQALEVLTDQPLPDESLSFDGIPEDIHGKVREIGRLVDDACTVLFDLEARTAARRILHDIAVADPDIFRRKGRTDGAAAAVCWITMINNIENLYRHDGWVSVKELMSQLGVRTAPSQRAKPMVAALGTEVRDGRFDLGEPRYLTSSTRRELISFRDEYLPFVDGEEQD
ncbi:MAG: hypothetical protein J2P23_14365 [Microlunatus sp.]|nr:hypothetical protein [Microlunatus sp.]